MSENREQRRRNERNGLSAMWSHERRAMTLYRRHAILFLTESLLLVSGHIRKELEKNERFAYGGGIGSTSMKKAVQLLKNSLEETKTDIFVSCNVFLSNRSAITGSSASITEILTLMSSWRHFFYCRNTWQCWRSEWIYLMNILSSERPPNSHQLEESNKEEGNCDGRPLNGMTKRRAGLLDGARSRHV